MAAPLTPWMFARIQIGTLFVERQDTNGQRNADLKCAVVFLLEVGFPG
ncbi:hypothetical protein [Sinomonas gamaensis]|nr:hypothetical protein [Sinomonas gamaensis]